MLHTYHDGIRRLKMSHLRLVSLPRAGERHGADLTAPVVFRAAFTHTGVWVDDPRRVARCLGCGISGGYEAFGLRSPHQCVLRFLRTTVGSSLVRAPPCIGSSRAGVGEGCYLVDPASSHMLVSKIKPCMCKYELIQTVKLRMAH